MRIRPASYGAVAGVAIFGAFLLGPSRAQQPAGQTKAAPKAQPNAQPKGQPKGDDKPLVFTTGARLVVADVTVKDKNGAAIAGLKQSDFAIYEDNVKQNLAVFEAQVLTSEAEPPPELKLDDQLKLPETPNTTITFEAPGKVQYHDKRLMVFFFDFSSMRVADQLRAQDAAMEFLNKKITKDDMVAVMLYTSTVNVLTDFTDDRDMLTDVIKGMPIGETSELAGLADTGSCYGEDTGAAFVADETEFNIFNTDQKLHAIEKVAQDAGDAAGEESAGLLLRRNQQDRNRQPGAARSFHQRSIKANMVMYPIDARGLMADPPGGAASSAASRGTGIFNGSSYNSQRSTINDSQETLTTLAADTGGKAFLDSNDLALGISRRSSRSAAITSSATTPPIPKKTANTAGSRSS